MATGDATSVAEPSSPAASTSSTWLGRAATERFGYSADQAAHIEQFSCAAVAGVLAMAITHPLDTWSVFRQTGRPLPKNPLAFFRGLGPAALQGAFIYSVMLGGYEALRGWGWSLPAAAAACSVPESLFRGPLEAIKNLRQTSYSPGGPLKVAATIAVGTLGTLAREIPGNITYFTTYEFAQSRGAGAALAGAVTGAAYTVVCYPIETVRTQVVTGVKSPWPTFRGVGPYLGRSVLITVCVQQFYELLLGRPMGEHRNARSEGS